MSSFFPPLFYAVVVILLLWQAFRVISKGMSVAQVVKKDGQQTNVSEGDRTGKLTVHPELLDQEGRITDEELLAVRFSGDNDPPQSIETNSE